MDIEKLTKDVILKNMSPEQQKAVLDSVMTSVQESKKARTQKVAENVDLVMQALKKIEAKMLDRVSQAADKVETVASNVKDGKDGRDGKDGKDGKQGIQGPKGADGRNGTDGKDGKDGRDGIDGVSVVEAYLDFDNSLVIELSNGKQINVGAVLSDQTAEKVQIVANGGAAQPLLDAIAALQTEITNLIPSQTGNSGKFLTTDGSALSWASVVGGLSYQGTWNASTNSPTLASGTGTNGHYYVVGVSGSTNLDGVTDWVVGDWVLYNGTAWQKLDNTDLVSSVNGKTGTVVLTTTDVSEGTNQYYTDARARGAVSAGTGISYSSSTGVITNSAPDQTVTLTAGSGVSITGTYPSFTVANTGVLTETDPIYTASSWYSTTNNSSNWNTAYGWGNHASAGYLTTSSAAATYYPLTNPSGYTNNTGTVTSVGGTGSVSGLTLSGTVTSSGSLTLGGSLNLSSPPAIGGTTPNTGAFSTLDASGTTTLKGEVLIDNAAGSGGSAEGGELHFAIPTASTTLNGPIAIDIYQNKMRFFETTGSNRGAYLDLSACTGGVGTNLAAGGGGSGTVTSITAGTGLSGGTITTSGTIALANTAVTAGSYTNANITVDAQGRVTSAANGSSGSTLVFPFYTSAGVSDTIALIGSTLLPFFNSAGTAKNIALIS